MKKWLLIVLTILCLGISGCEQEKPEIDSVMMMEKEGNELSTVIFEILSIFAIFAVLANLSNRKR